MLNNMRETSDYFIISKKHANQSFRLMILSSMVGVILLGLAICFAIANIGITPSLIACAGFAMSGLIAATSFAVYKKSLSQLNYYYYELRENQIFLSVVGRIEKLSMKKQDEMNIELIKSLINKTWETKRE